MSTLREAAQQALEAMSYSGMDVSKFNRVNGACAALRAALAEPEQPVGINGLTEAETTASASVAGLVGKPEQEPDGISWLKRDSGYFTAPTPRKPVELTEEEIRSIPERIGMAPSHDGRTIRSIGHSRGMTLQDGIAFARAVIAAYEAKQGEQK